MKTKEFLRSFANDIKRELLRHNSTLKNAQDNWGVVTCGEELITGITGTASGDLTLDLSAWGFTSVDDYDIFTTVKNNYSAISARAWVDKQSATSARLIAMTGQGDSVAVYYVIIAKGFGGGSGSGGSGGTVDQTYDATSTNAQSGTAVAEAVATKADGYIETSSIAITLDERFQTAPTTAGQILRVETEPNGTLEYVLTQDDIDAIAAAGTMTGHTIRVANANAWLEIEILIGGTYYDSMYSDGVTRINSAVLVTETVHQIEERLIPDTTSLPTGGTTGQALIKVSDADGDADWGDVQGGSTTFDITAIPQGSTGANEINAVVSNKDTENARVSYIRQSDGTLPNTVNLGVKSGLGEDAFELTTPAYVNLHSAFTIEQNTTTPQEIWNAINHGRALMFRTAAGITKSVLSASASVTAASFICATDSGEGIVVWSVDSEAVYTSSANIFATNAGLTALDTRVTEVENKFSTKNYIFADTLLLDVDLPYTMPWDEFSAMGFPQSTLQENTVYNVVTFNSSYDKEYPKIRYFNDSQEGAIKTIRYKLDERQSSASSKETLVVEYDIANQTATITTGGTAGISKSHIKVYSPRSVYGVTGKVSEDFDLRVLENAATKSEVGDLTALSTTAQDSLVSAVNELKYAVDGLGEPFRVKEWSNDALTNTTIPSCNQDIANTSIDKLTFKIVDQEAIDYQVVGMIAYQLVDASGNRLNAWPVCQFTGQNQTELQVRFMCAGTTNKTAKSIKAWVLLKHR